MAKRKINLNVDQVSAEILADGSNRLDALTAGADWTNNRQIAQPKMTQGSGGRLTADGTAHTGPCTLLGYSWRATVAGQIALSDAVGAAGTTIFTIEASLNGSAFVPINGLAFGTGIFADFTGLTGEFTAYVGPAVS